MDGPTLVPGVARATPFFRSRSVNFFFQKLSFLDMCNPRYFFIYFIYFFIFFFLLFSFFFWCKEKTHFETKCKCKKTNTHSIYQTKLYVRDRDVAIFIFSPRYNCKKNKQPTKPKLIKSNNTHSIYKTKVYVVPVSSEFPIQAIQLSPSSFIHYSKDQNSRSLGNNLKIFLLLL